MRNSVSAFLRDYRQLAVIASLTLATVLCVVLLALRAVYSRSFGHFGLAWNLFLAWLPLLSALVVYNLRRNSSRYTGWLVAVCALLWLVFFPNAPYILTDLIHLRAANGVPLWYDLILLLSFAWTGLFLGLASLYLMQVLVRRAAGWPASWLFVLLVLALCGFGVYLGRFPRWNSWDVLTSPVSLAVDIGHTLRHPLDNLQAFAFSALFATMLGAVYLMLMALVNLREPAGPPGK
jgi:uncharacterized membrane protein